MGPSTPLPQSLLRKSAKTLAQLGRDTPSIGTGPRGAEETVRPLAAATLDVNKRDVQRPRGVTRAGALKPAALLF